VQIEKNERAKVYLILALGVIFCLVGYFRFFYRTSNQTTGASPVIAPTAEALVVPAISVPSQGTNVQEPAAQEMVRDTVRDIFAPGRSVEPREDTSRGQAEAAPHQQQLTLSGMIYSVRNPVAIINGQFLHTGDRIGGYKIVRIGPKEVCMTADDREIVLRVVDHGKN